MVQRRLQHGAGTLNVDALIISPLAADRNLRRGMHHAVHAGHRQIHSLRVRNIAAYLLKTGANRIRQKRRNTRITTLKNAHIIAGTQQRQHALTTQQTARTGKEDALATTRREIGLRAASGCAGLRNRAVGEVTACEVDSRDADKRGAGSWEKDSREE